MAMKAPVRAPANNIDIIPDDVREDAEELLGEEAETWLATPNTLFLGRSPNDLIDSGEVARVKEVLLRFRYGLFT